MYIVELILVLYNIFGTRLPSSLLFLLSVLWLRRLRRRPARSLATPGLKGGAAAVRGGEEGRACVVNEGAFFPAKSCSS